MVSYTFKISKDARVFSTDWKTKGLMACILEETVDREALHKHGAILLQEIRNGASVSDIMKRIVKLIETKKISDSELFVFTEYSWQFHNDFTHAHRCFGMSLLTGSIQFENNL